MESLPDNMLGIGISREELRGHLGIAGLEIEIPISNFTAVEFIKKAGAPWRLHNGNLFWHSVSCACDNCLMADQFLTSAEHDGCWFAVPLTHNRFTSGHP